MKAQRILDIVTGLLRNYPALSAALVNILVLLAAKYGLNVSAAELAVIGSGVAAILGLGVHQSVTPVVRVLPPD
jgi:hypothetical protein